MGPREEDNSVLLLGAVGIICGLIACVPWLLEPTPALAGKAPERASYAASIQNSALAPARVIVPFTPNTTPGER
jgi:hypothetical protein